MEQIDERTYACTLCNVVVVVDSDENPVTMLSAQSGGPNIRIVTVADVEVHRCVLPDVPRGVRK